MNYKGFTIEGDKVKNKNGFNVSPDANGYYHIPPSERLTIEQIRAKTGVSFESVNQVEPQMIEHKEVNGNLTTESATQFNTQHFKSATQRIKKAKKVLESATQPLKVQHNKGQNNGKSDGVYIIAGIRYDSAQQAHEATKIRLNTLIKNCKIGYSFEPK